MTKIRIMGPAVEVAAALEALRACKRIEVATVSDLLPTRGSRSGPRWVRAYVNAVVRPQVEPCHGTTAAVWVGETTSHGSRVDLWACMDCASTWTTPVQPDVTR